MHDAFSQLEFVDGTTSLPAITASDVVHFLVVRLACDVPTAVKCAGFISLAHNNKDFQHMLRLHIVEDLLFGEMLYEAHSTREHKDRDGETFKSNVVNNSLLIPTARGFAWNKRYRATPLESLTPQSLPTEKDADICA